MKNRAISYIKKLKARKVLQNPLAADLNSFLQATMVLSRSNVVKKHISQTVRELQSPNWYKMTA